jgi:hypothetical protein
MRSIITVKIKKLSDVEKLLKIKNFVKRRIGKEQTINPTSLANEINYVNKRYGKDYPEDKFLLDEILDVSKWRHKELLKLMETFNELKISLGQESEEKNNEINEEIKKISDKIAIIEAKYLKVVPALIIEDEYDSEIFRGYLMDNQTRISITRMNDCEITIRLSNSKLKKLQESTTDFVRSILASDGLLLGRNEVEICEKEELNILLSGKIIPDFWKEVFSRDRKNVVISSFLTFLSIALYLIIYQNFPIQLDDPWKETLGRFFTGFVTTASVAFLGLVQTYYEIKGKLILWNVQGDELN